MPGSWAPGGAYEFQINNATGVAGVNWDRLNVTNALTISALTSSARFTVKLISLDVTNGVGTVTNFIKTGTYAWPMASFGSLAGTFSPGLFTVDAGGFVNPVSGSFTVVQNGAALELRYAPRSGTIMLVR